MQASEKKAAKKAANIAAAADRLAKHQAADKARVAAAAAKLADHFANLGERSRRQAEEKAKADAAAAKLAEEAKFVEDALAGPSALPLRRWLKDRQPTFDRVQRFFNERPNLQRVAQKQAA